MHLAHFYLQHSIMLVLKVTSLWWFCLLFIIMTVLLKMNFNVLKNDIEECDNRLNEYENNKLVELMKWKSAVIFKLNNQSEKIKQKLLRNITI